MLESGKENPLNLPKRKIFDEEANSLSVQNGGVGGKGIDVPAFMRKEQEKAAQLPHNVVDKSKLSNN